MGVMYSMGMFSLFLSIILVSPILSEEAGYLCPEYEVDFHEGYNLESIENVPSWSDCGYICTHVSTCKFWTYWTGSTYEGYCWLKSSDHGLEHVVHSISGQRGCH